jgi:hypothetical protein
VTVHQNLRVEGDTSALNIQDNTRSALVTYTGRRLQAEPELVAPLFGTLVTPGPRPALMLELVSQMNKKEELLEAFVEAIREFGELADRLCAQLRPPDPPQPPAPPEPPDAPEPAAPSPPKGTARARRSAGTSGGRTRKRRAGNADQAKPPDEA